LGIAHTPHPYGLPLFALAPVIITGAGGNVTLAGAQRY